MCAGKPHASAWSARIQGGTSFGGASRLTTCTDTGRIDASCQASTVPPRSMTDIDSILGNVALSHSHRRDLLLAPSESGASTKRSRSACRLLKASPSPVTDSRPLCRPNDRMVSPPRHANGSARLFPLPGRSNTRVTGRVRQLYLAYPVVEVTRTCRPAPCGRVLGRRHGTSPDRAAWMRNDNAEHQNAH